MNVGDSVVLVVDVQQVPKGSKGTIIRIENVMFVVSVFGTELHCFNFQIEVVSGTDDATGINSGSNAFEQSGQSVVGQGASSGEGSRAGIMDEGAIIGDGVEQLKGEIGRLVVRVKELEAALFRHAVRIEALEKAALSVA